MLCADQVVNISVEPFSTKTVTGSPQAILAAMRALPDINAEDVDCLEAAIAAGRLPMSAQSIFDDDGIVRSNEKLSEIAPPRRRGRRGKRLLSKNFRNSAYSASLR